MAFKGLPRLPLFLIKHLSPSKGFTNTSPIQIDSSDTAVLTDGHIKNTVFCTTFRPCEGIRSETINLHVALHHKMKYKKNIFSPKVGAKLRVKLRCYCWLQFSRKTLLILMSWRGEGANHILTELYAIFFVCFILKRLDEKITEGNGIN